MPTLSIQNQNGEAVGQIELADSIFAAPVREHLLWEVVVAQQAGRRRGCASTKSRSEVRGSTRKLYRQKGTGRARHGSIRSPIYVGGGAAFGPKPRSYEMRVPKKVKRSALISALSLRVLENKLVVVKDLDLAQIRTQAVALLLGRLGVERGLIIEDKGNVALVKSSRNLAQAKWLAPEGLNVYDILKYPSLIVTERAVKEVEQRLLSHG